MSDDALIIELPAGALLTLPADAVAAFKASLRAQRRLATPKRDLAVEIEAFLTRRGVATVPEIARSIAARDADVRRMLEADDRFVRVSTAAGRSSKAKPWSLALVAARPVPAAGTSPSSELS